MDGSTGRGADRDDGLGLRRSPAGHVAETSANWAGYAATGATFTSVVGSCTQPSATCSGKAQYASVWVGIDGFLPGDTAQVEQVGADADCSKKGANYYAWWDMFPAVSHSFSRKLCPVTAGDAMTAAVSSSGGRFTLRITDATRGWTCSAPTQSSPAPELSAEWVVEDPANNSTGSLLKLSDFATVHFAGASADGETLSSLTTDVITMVARHVVKAVASPILGDGASFNVTWQHS